MGLAVVRRRYSTPKLCQQLQHVSASGSRYVHRGISVFSDVPEDQGAYQSPSGDLMKAGTVRLLAAVAFGSLFSVAQAAPTISWSGGANPYNDVGNDFGAWFGGSSSSVSILEQGTISIDDVAKVTIEYFGKEAGFNTNEFWWGQLGPYGAGTWVASTGVGTTNPVPDPVPATPGSPITTFVVPGVVSAGVLPFYFGLTDSRVGGTVPRAVPNGHVDPTGTGDDLGFWFGRDNGALRTSGTSVWVLFDDSGGNQDNDHDDMIMRISVEAVPEPSTWMMLIGGLGLLGFMAKRRARMS
jgi:hypothetical protein